MTVRQNMGFALRLEHLAKEQIDHRVREVAIALELDEFPDRKARAASRRAAGKP
jgi:multiple sugar transport system ATP-binding protein